LAPETAEIVQGLKNQGWRLCVASGDSPAAVEKVAGELGITDFQGNLLPGQKQARVREFQKLGHTVAMAGDGINDAPALAQADIGLAMRHGTDVALHTAGVTLLRPGIRGILDARNLSAAVRKNIRQNLWLAFLYNVIAIPLAAGALYPAFGLQLTPVWAGLAMSSSSLSVIFNALRLSKIS
jgi:Cu+-exporting ATPase